MAIAFVEANGGNVTTTTGTFALPHKVAVKDLLAVLVTSFIFPSYTPSVTDNLNSGSWSAPVINSFNGGNLQSWIKWIDCDTATTVIPTTITSGTATISATNAFTANQKVSVDTTVGTGAGQLLANTTYFVSATGLSGSGFQLSATSGGASITPNANGSPGVFANLVVTVGSNLIIGGGNSDVTLVHYNGFTNGPAVVSADLQTINSGTGTTASATGFSNSQTNELVIGFLSSQDNIGAATSWTSRDNEHSHHVYDQILATSGNALTLSATISSSQPWYGFILPIYDGAGSGSVINTKSQTEGITIVDVLTKVRKWVRSLVESIVVVDQNTKLLKITRSIQDTFAVDPDGSSSINNSYLGDPITLADLLAESTKRNALLNEAITIVDSLVGQKISPSGAINTKTISDAIAVIDSLSNYCLRTRSQIDGFLTSDTQVKALALARALGDSITVTDQNFSNVAGVRVKQLLEAINLNDQQSRTLKVTLQLLEALTIFDLNSAVIVRFASNLPYLTYPPVIGVE